MSNSKSKMVGCAACGTTNRVPEGKMSADAKCGRCGIALRNGEPAILTAENFAALAERSDIPLLVDFWAPWRSEEHTSELQSLMRNSYAVFCLQNKKNTTPHTN